MRTQELMAHRVSKAAARCCVSLGARSGPRTAFLHPDIREPSLKGAPAKPACALADRSKYSYADPGKAWDQ